jgi:hypothetical protein
MNKMYIINGPRFFGATWSLIKGWLDPRTANKIEVISSRKAWEKALLDYVDEDQLPSDYGGKGPDTQETIEKEAFTGKLKHMHTEVIYLRYVIAGVDVDVDVDCFTKETHDSSSSPLSFPCLLLTMTVDLALPSTRSVLGRS